MRVAGELHERHPDAGDIEEALSDLTGRPFSECGRIVREAISQGYLDYDHLAGPPDRPWVTDAGSRLLG